MTRFPLTTSKALILSLIVSAISIWLSLRFQDWSWFARSGSIIVVIGLFLTSTQIIENSRRLNMRRRHHGHNFGRDFADDIKKRTLEDSRHHDEDVWESGLKGLYLLIIGTVIWGYGDLLAFFFNG